jgi:Mg2+ and Co2+ transporter CorA
MIETYLLGKNTWVDVTNPSEQELTELLLKYDIDMPAQVLLDFSMQSGIKKRSDLIYTVLRFPRLYEDHNAPNRTSFEIDFICTENLLITVHDIPLFEIDAVKNKLTSTTEDRNSYMSFIVQYVIHWLV